MDCKETEKYVSSFLEYSLSGEELRAFLKHIDNCPECKEELGTSYLLDVALERIEEGETVMLDVELNHRLRSAQRALSYHFVFSNTFRIIEVVAGIVLSLSAVRAFVLYALSFVMGL